MWNCTRENICETVSIFSKHIYRNSSNLSLSSKNSNVSVAPVRSGQRSFWSGQRTFPCSIPNFSFVLCLVFLSRLWALRFEPRKRLFCRWWLMLETLSLWYFEFCLWTIEADKLLSSFLIYPQISIKSH